MPATVSNICSLHQCRSCWQAGGVATFIERFTFPTSSSGGPPSPLRVAIKDLIDLAGVPTTAGSRVVAATAQAAKADAACLAGIRAAEVRGEVAIVGKVRLHELAFGVSGINHWFGTPTNPLDPARIPGGSSSGSAVAVATDQADMAIGTDTGGSIRIPAACCGVAGLKTTAGLVSNEGVRALAPSLDTVGPMARDIAGLIAGMALLDPAWRYSGEQVEVVARVRLPASEHIDVAIDTALAAAGLGVVDVELPGWASADAAAAVVLLAEAWVSNGHLVNAGLGDDVADRLRQGAKIEPRQLDGARQVGDKWRRELRALIERIGPVVIPTLAADPPLLEDAGRTGRLRYTLPVNLAGFPALTLPVPGATLPVGLQIIGLPHSEAMLLGTGEQIQNTSGPL